MADLPEWITVIFSAIAVIISVTAFLRSKTTAKSEVFIELRYRFIDIFDKLPDNYKSKDWKPEKGTKDWARIQEYWYHSFNEWFITNKLDKWYLHPLWHKYYSISIWNGLKHYPMRFVLIHMTSEELSFAGYSKEFEKVLNQLWKRYSKDTKDLQESVK